MSHDADHTLRSAENLLTRDFTARRANQKLVSDIVYTSTAEGWLYLAVVLELYSRRVIGWPMSDRIDEAQVEAAIRMALDHRPVSTELIVHSDRGSQYAAKGIQATLSGLKIRQSMSRTGNCWDNAVSESFFGSRKQALNGPHVANRNEARAILFEYIEIFYNRQPLHSSLGYMTPIKFSASMPRADAHPQTLIRYNGQGH